MEVSEYRDNKEGAFFLLCTSLAFMTKKYFISPLENTSVGIINKGEFYAFEGLGFIWDWNSNTICSMWKSWKLLSSIWEGKRVVWVWGILESKKGFNSVFVCLFVFPCSWGSFKKWNHFQMLGSKYLQSTPKIKLNMKW